MRITYNSPIVLTYTLICTLIIVLDSPFSASVIANGKAIAEPGSICKNFFMVYPFGTTMMDLYNPLTYFRLFSHALGHAGWEHLVGNFTFILLLGPILEEKYGSKMVGTMIFVTAFATGLLNAFFFQSGLLGASGIVFMMILLVSFTNAKRGSIPLTFILIALLYLGKEIYSAAFVNNQTSEFAHIIGGLFGGFFGYMLHNMPEKKVSNDNMTGL
ncbi:MAG: rhomboid family intramembrane serine protease [Bacteroidetes bacterium]|nr:MAG: rhomboid family intramembrane serine protease [Bacteroidota bacterium]TAG95677.1 MAG: rhomboid family intramembrane serine protease [Bacteroidota bacterium]